MSAGSLLVEVWPGEVSAVERDPYSATNFEVDFGAGGIGFAEVSGLGCEIEYGYDPDAEHASEREPTAITSRVNDVTLRRGMTGDPAVWDWVGTVLSGRYEARSVTITLLDARHEAACSWVLRGARPTRWVGPRLDANSAGVAMEELVLSADSLEFVPPEPR